MTTPTRAVPTVDPLTRAERRRLTTPPVGTPFDPDHQLFPDFRSGDVFDYGWTEAHDLATMLGRDGKARSLEQVLTLPIRSAPWQIIDPVGDSGQAKLVRDNLGPHLGRIIDQATSACTYRKAFFETTWRQQAGQIVYEAIDWRPATGCEAGWDPKTGRARGFRQREVPLPGRVPTMAYSPDGYRYIHASRAFIFTHGTHRDPVRGVSDLDVAHWAYETRQKILFLWFQFLEQQSLPKTVVWADTIDQARELAQDVASVKASGVLGLPRNNADPTAKTFDVLASDGSGAAQFERAVAYLEQQMTTSVLAGFTDLPTNSTTGSFALSQDQSEFFLSARQAVADELAQSIDAGLIAPLIVHNYGPDAPMPTITIGPISRRTTERALSLLTAVVSAPQLNIPREFVDQLTQGVATHLGLDEQQVADAITAEVKRREQADKLKDEQARTLLAAQKAGTTGPPAGPANAARAAAGKPKLAAVRELSRLSAAVDTAYALVREAA